ncbi:hypothetical protein ElyMa_005631400 [Elysia marginata]|uniref:SRCR domain-containing protein n=1 Tax=Elysia marginata TaxID=1093978 RepID=A0AAV4F9T4_9GAST|nr:hypothetical protein ElyMa_005631400 [Elysia marginata]
MIAINFRNQRSVRISPTSPDTGHRPDNHSRLAGCESDWSSPARLPSVSRVSNDWAAHEDDSITVREKDDPNRSTQVRFQKVWLSSCGGLYQSAIPSLQPLVLICRGNKIRTLQCQLWKTSFC